MDEAALSAAIARSMAGIRPRKVQAADEELSAIAARILQAQKDAEPMAAVQDTAVEVVQVRANDACCTACKQPIVAAEQDVVRRAGCGHVTHLACMATFIRAGRQYCGACPDPALHTSAARVAGGYTVDTGNDTDVRAAVVMALAYQRDKARQGAHTQPMYFSHSCAPPALGRIEAGGAHSVLTGQLDPFRARDAAIMKQRMWPVVGRQPGGAPPPGLLARFTSKLKGNGSTAALVPGWPCADSDCGGPQFCVHRYMTPVATAAALLWRVYDVPLPLCPGHEVTVPAARACVDALLKARAHPRDMQRCGADAERLAVLGYTIDDLVRRYGLPFEEVAKGLDLTWDRLVALGWHPALLEHRRDYHVVTLVEAPVLCTAERLLRTFAVAFDAGLYATGVTSEELVALGFRGPLLVQIGMRAEHVADMMRHADVVARGGAQWLCQQFDLTPEFLAAMPCTPEIMRGDIELQRGYAALTIQANDPTNTTIRRKLHCAKK